MSNQLLGRKFFAQPADQLAPQLLNKVLFCNGVSGRIVEVEAYDGGNDPASHAFRGMTPRNEVMFGPPGHLYVYFTYGMHFCANVVCGTDGVASAVLLRALSPLTGIDEMYARRGRVRETHLASGPGRLCQALGIDRTHNGADLTNRAGAIKVIDDGAGPPEGLGISTRVGIRVATDRMWRWWVAGDSHVSKGKPS